MTLPQPPQAYNYRYNCASYLISRKYDFAHGRYEKWKQSKYSHIWWKKRWRKIASVFLYDEPKDLFTPNKILINFAEPYCVRKICSGTKFFMAERDLGDEIPELNRWDLRAHDRRMKMNNDRFHRTERNLRLLRIARARKKRDNQRCN